MNENKTGPRGGCISLVDQLNFLCWRARACHSQNLPKPNNFLIEIAKVCGLGFFRWTAKRGRLRVHLMARKRARLL